MPESKGPARNYSNIDTSGFGKPPQYEVRIRRPTGSYWVFTECVQLETGVGGGPYAQFSSALEAVAKAFGEPWLPEGICTTELADAALERIEVVERLNKRLADERDELLAAAPALFCQIGKAKVENDRLRDRINQLEQLVGEREPEDA